MLPQGAFFLPHELNLLVPSGHKCRNALKMHYADYTYHAIP